MIHFLYLSQALLIGGKRGRVASSGGGLAEEALLSTPPRPPFTSSSSSTYNKMPHSSSNKPSAAGSTGVVATGSPTMVARHASSSSIPDEEQQHDVEDPEKGRLLKDTPPRGGVKTAFERDSMAQKALQLVICFVGLQVTYIMWGVIQEKVMTQPYGDASVPEYFPSSTFLVFSNRLLALVMSAAIVYLPTGDPRRRTLKAPLIEFAPSSLSNILSSWAQYEALKYVSFPTQVLSKSSKIIPVMLVGKLIQQKTYPWGEYAEAALITMGVGIFSLNEKKPKAGKGSGGQDSMLGILLLAMYLTCDSFTSQWQDKVYKKYQVNQFQMMLGINICSIALTGLSLLQTGQGAESVAFMYRHPESISHIVWLSVSSSMGQLFIFYTIKRFGPIVFTIIMTIRQMLSMVVSCLLYGHPMAWQSVIGAVICFSTIGYRVKRNLQKRKGRAAGGGGEGGGGGGGGAGA